MVYHERARSPTTPFLPRDFSPPSPATTVTTMLPGGGTTGHSWTKDIKMGSNVIRENLSNPESTLKRRKKVGPQLVSQARPGPQHDTWFVYLSDF